MYEERQFQVCSRFRAKTILFNQKKNFSYRFGHILRTLRALQSSTKTSLRIDEDGLLSLQFLMPSPKPKHVPGGSKDAFIEFRVSVLKPS
jgi:cell cycle checkpoint protein